MIARSASRPDSRPRWRLAAGVLAALTNTLPAQPGSGTTLAWLERSASVPPTGTRCWTEPLRSLALIDMVGPHSADLAAVLLVPLATGSDGSGALVSLAPPGSDAGTDAWAAVAYVAADDPTATARDIRRLLSARLPVGPDPTARHDSQPSRTEAGTPLFLAAGAHGVSVGTDESLVDRWAAGPPPRPSRIDDLADVENPEPPGLLLFADLGAIRRATPRAFAAGPGNRLLAAAGLSNARDVLLHATLGEPTTAPPALLIALTWSLRSEPPHALHRLRQPLRATPHALAAIPPHAWAALPIDYGALVARLAALHAASLDDNARRRFARTLWAWSQEHGPRQRRLVRSLADWSFLMLDRDGPTLVAPIRPGVRIERFEADLTLLLERAGIGEHAEGAWTVGPRTGSGVSAPIFVLRIEPGTPPALRIEPARADQTPPPP